MRLRAIGDAGMTMFDKMPILNRIDPFILMLIAVVVAASLLPVRGAGAVFAGGVTNAAIVLLFFLHGAKLSRDAILSGFGAWRIHLTVLAATFGLFPLLGIAGIADIADIADIANIADIADFADIADIADIDEVTAGDRDHIPGLLADPGLLLSENQTRGGGVVRL